MMIPRDFLEKLEEMEQDIGRYTTYEPWSPAYGVGRGTYVGYPGTFFGVEIPPIPERIGSQWFDRLCEWFRGLKEYRLLLADPICRAFLIEIMEKYLGDREFLVMSLRLGLQKQPYSLQDIASLFNVSRERIRQIETKALRKLRTKDEHYQLWRCYQEYLDEQEQSA